MAADSAGTGKTASLPETVKRRFGWVSISLSAFIMSLTATLISAYYGFQGAEVVVQSPERILLYRDGVGESSILSMAVRTEMINTASGYGDVLLDASLVPARGAPAFSQEGLVTPAFTQNAEEAAKGCELGASCIGLPGLLLVHRSDQVMDLPSGAARAIVPYFWLSPSSCEGEEAACARFATFDQAVSALAERPLEIRMRLRFHSDGERELTCRSSKLDAAYLREIGWTQLGCTEAAVSGDPLF